MAIRCPLATEKLVRVTSSIVRGHPYSPQGLRYAFLALVSIWGEPQHFQRLRNDLVDTPAWVHAGIRILKDHLETARQRGFGATRDAALDAI